LLQKREAGRRGAIEGDEDIDETREQQKKLSNLSSKIAPTSSVLLSCLSPQSFDEIKTKAVNSLSLNCVAHDFLRFTDEVILCAAGLESQRLPSGGILEELQEVGRDASGKNR